MVQVPIQVAMARMGLEPRRKKYARMAAKDCISINRLAKSYDIKQGLWAQNYEPLDSPTAVAKEITKYAEEIKATIKRILKEKEEEGQRFSFTTDEWTKSVRRFCNINVHFKGGDFMRIGMVRVRGSLTSERAAELFRNKLAEFDLNEDKHIGLTSDAASVMCKMGRILKLHHQLCHAHGLHLAVCDIIYKKKVEEEPQSQTESETADDESEGEDDDDEEGEFVVEEGVAESHDEDFLDVDTDITIKKVRRIVKFFQVSPTRHDILQDIVKKGPEGKELHLILDVKTRWSTLCACFERFYHLRVEVKDALMELDKLDMFPSEAELNHIQAMSDALSIVEAGSRDLCNRGENLATADQVRTLHLQGTFKKGLSIFLISIQSFILTGI